MIREDAAKLLDEHVAALGEHFEAVQILVSDSDGDGTRSCFRGTGNYFARKGMADTFCKRDMAEESAHYIAEAMKSEEE